MTSTHPSAGGQSLPFECGYAHLGHIAKMFASGNFKAPMLIHDTNPPDAATMTRLKEQIRYEFSETDRGARIRLVHTT
jgi:hypothetical protein